jgi:predicted ATPase
LDLLSFIGRNIGDLALVVLAAYREEPARTEWPLGDLQAGGLLEDMELIGLAVEDVRLLTESTVGGPVDERTAQKVQDFTNGNPLFVEELSRRLASALDRADSLKPGRLEEILRTDLPKSIRTFMAERFYSLSAETQYLLQLAACFGRNFDILLHRRYCHY